jgi:hypothetical protein
VAALLSVRWLSGRLLLANNGRGLGVDARFEQLLPTLANDSAGSEYGEPVALPEAGHICASLKVRCTKWCYCGMHTGYALFKIY